MRMYLGILCILVSAGSHAITVGDIVSPFEDYTRCYDLDWYERVICAEVTREVHRALGKNNIALEEGNVVWRDKPVEPQKLDTGHSCTKKLRVRDSFLEAKLLSNTALSFKGDSVSKPFVFIGHTYLDVYARIDLREEWGSRMLLGSCNRLGSNSIHVHSSATPEAIVTVAIFFETDIDRGRNGDYSLTIKPIVDVSVAVEKIDFNFEISGQGFLSIFADAYVFFGQAMKMITTGLSGNSITADAEQLGIDFGVIFLRSIDWSLNTFGDSAHYALVESYVERQFFQEVDQFEQEQTEKLRARIGSALGLDSNGERVFVFDESLPRGHLGASLVAATGLLL